MARLTPEDTAAAVAILTAIEADDRAQLARILLREAARRNSDILGDLGPDELVAALEVADAARTRDAGALADAVVAVAVAGRPDLAPLVPVAAMLAERALAPLLRRAVDRVQERSWLDRLFGWMR